MKKLLSILLLGTLVATQAACANNDQSLKEENDIEKEVQYLSKNQLLKNFWEYEAFEFSRDEMASNWERDDIGPIDIIDTAFMFQMPYNIFNYGRFSDYDIKDAYSSDFYEYIYSDEKTKNSITHRNKITTQMNELHIGSSIYSEYTEGTSNGEANMNSIIKFNYDNSTIQHDSHWTGKLDSDNWNGLFEYKIMSDTKEDRSFTIISSKESHQNRPQVGDAYDSEATWFELHDLSYVGGKIVYTAYNIWKSQNTTSGEEGNGGFIKKLVWDTKTNKMGLLNYESWISLNSLTFDEDLKDFENNWIENSSIKTGTRIEHTIAELMSMKIEQLEDIIWNWK